MTVSRKFLSALALAGALALSSQDHALSCDELLKQTRLDTDKAAKVWNVFIEEFNKYAFVPDYSNSGGGKAQLRNSITEIRSLIANTSGFITQASQMNCRMDYFKPSQDALTDITQQLERAVLQLSP